MLNSEKNSAEDLNQYQFLGVLMGICIRTGAKMILDLPKMVWKQLVGQKINIDDISEVESRFVSMVSQVLMNSLDEYSLNPLHWETEMPDGKTISLIEESDSFDQAAPVAYSDRMLWIERALKNRLSQSQA